MQFSKIALIAALAAPLASAQNLAGLPSCALTPAISALGSTGCALTDVSCICKNTAFLTGLQKQVTAACSAADLATALQFAVTLCNSVGISLSISTPAAATTAPVTSTTFAAAPTTTPTTTAAATTMTTTMAMTSAAAMTSVVAASSAAPSSAVVVSAISDGQPQVPSATPSSAVVVSVISDGQPQVPTNATTLTTPTVTPFKGAAATAQAQYAGVAMLVGAVGAFFAL